MNSGTIVAESWIGLPRKDYTVSPGMMRYGSEAGFFSLHDATGMDVASFNESAKPYDVLPLSESDPPIDRLVRVSVLLSRMAEDVSSIPYNPRYVDMALAVAAAKAEHDKLIAKGATSEAEQFEQLAGFYRTLKAGPWHAVAEILRFHELLKKGTHKGKYLATPYAFGGDGRLVQADSEIVIAPEGWTRVLGRRGYPTETDKDACYIEGIECAALSGGDLQGYWYIGSDPAGQERIVLRGPSWVGGSLLNAHANEGRSCSYGHVGALRTRGPQPED